MNRSNKLILLIAVVIAILTLLIAASEMGLLTDTNNYNVNLTELNDELTIDMSNWKYDEKNNIYYQIGLVYCTDPEATEYESLGIYVPGDYFKSERNDNGTYTCTVIDKLFCIQCTYCNAYQHCRIFRSKSSYTI